ncbi:B12-binding domain-containing radical SAM protein [Desulfoferula mesophila]|uniref:B12-binding domain-containing radical SAM protein n=1 Tax=Desulfoferula mesophila TaxID=3058419 RepID=A0AAU9EAK9_9BACT|nr:B12-binding domain-containing radical SAM protein [Desulfoferula mesophilus]
MPKVLIVSPNDSRIGPNKNTWTPLFIASAAAVLENTGCTVRVFDRLAHSHRGGQSLAGTHQAMLSLVSSFKPDLVLIEANPESIYDTCHCARDIKALHDAPLGIFGAHATALPALAFQKIPQIDLLIEGEAEIPLAQLVSGDWSSASGVWLRDGDEARPPSRRSSPIDMDLLPFPAFHLMDTGYYAMRGTDTIWCHYLSSLTLMTSRGCTGRCAYCLESRDYGPGLRFRSLELVLEDVERCLRDYNLDAIYLRDCNFLVDRRRCARFCEMLLERNLHRRLLWSAQVRADCVEGGLLGLMKKAGCTSLEFGVETPNQDHLRAMDKTIPVEAAQKALGLCREVGIYSHAYLMRGLPGETLADLHASEAWVRKYRPSNFFWVKLHVFPGTPLYEQYGDSFFEDNPWDDRQAVHDYYRRNLSSVSLADLEEWLQKRARPLMARQRRICQIKANPPLALAGLTVQRVRNRALSLARKIGGGSDERE